ncbi:hypothetical protein MTR67_023892 [Solanum verrucosum]|uniref:TIR domain-containing protein n=1 Tax=Solanum verrucosum TaxID=315347 RepID=A0AAF0QUE5_SOLVR|nr:hypothetical protein MTR67_023892 [Solanum verrucosum]
MDCKTQYGQTVIPIFYDVDPSEVRNQKESFAEASAKHESKYRDDVEGIHKVKRWRTALSAAGDLKGYDIRQGKKEEYVNNKEDGKHLMAHRLRFKVLVVLDDINHGDHLDNLARDLDWFGKGSRITATTRDKHLIRKNDAVYEVTLLVDHQAIQLFNQHAFKKEVPDKSFEKLTLEVVGHANGLPLALKVWGSFLHNRDITAWKSAIEQIKMKSKLEIVEKLKISYDGLETTQ